MKSLLTICAAFIVGCTAEGMPPTPADTAMRAVRTSAVVSGPASRPIVAPGVLATRDEARLSFKVPGVVHRIHVREGEEVKAGQLVAELEQIEIDATVTQSRVALEKSRRDLERGRRLFEQGVASRQELEGLQTAQETAQAQFAAAEYNGRHALIRAPASGRVLRRMAEEREFVNAGAAILVLSTSAGFALRTALPQADFMEIRLDDAATVTLDVFPGRIFHGRVAELSHAADASTGTFAAEIEIEDADPGFATGLIARATLGVSAPRATRSYLPLSSLVEGDQAGVTVFLLDNDVARSREVAVAFLSGDHAALTNPLPAGTQVVTDGAAYLRDGERVRIVGE